MPCARSMRDDGAAPRLRTGSERSSVSPFEHRARHVRTNNLRTAYVGVHTVVLIEGRITCDALEEERHQLDAARPGCLGKQVVKRLRIPGTHVRWCFHLHEKYPGSRLLGTN